MQIKLTRSNIHWKPYEDKPYYDWNFKIIADTADPNLKHVLTAKATTTTDGHVTITFKGASHVFCCDEKILMPKCAVNRCLTQDVIALQKKRAMKYTKEFIAKYTPYIHDEK